jgi:hypothetical protein
MGLADLKAKKAPKQFAQTIHAPSCNVPGPVQGSAEPLWRTRLEPLREFSLFEIRFRSIHARQQRNNAGGRTTT